jgi:putative redox protein
MKHAISCRWTEGMAFESVIDGHSIVLDADEQFGGKNSGPRPKALILTSLAGCTGMDVISLLSKMKQPVSFFNMEVEAELSDEHPKTYTSITLVYQFKTEDGLDAGKVEKAVKLSQERYCGVSAMLREISRLEYRIEYID